eukprot:gene7894-12362_t
MTSKGGTTTIQRSNFTLFSVNDVYEVEKDKFGVGGMAELNTLLKKELKKAPYQTIVTLNGDFLSASALAQKFKGKHMIDILNTMPFDFYCIGNHEFDFGTDILIQRIKETQDTVKYLNSNIFVDKSKKELLPGTIETNILTLEGGMKVGLFGVCTEKTTSLSKPNPETYFEDILKSAKRCVKYLRETENVDCVIALTHLNVSEDVQLAKAVPEINIMIGGHDHFPHTQYCGETLIHKSGLDGRYLFRLQFELEKRTTEFKGKSFTKVNVFTTWKMIVNRGFEPDPETAKIVKFYVDQLPKDSNDPIVLVSSNLNSATEHLRSRETNMGNLVADSIKNKFNCDFGFICGGNIRNDTFYPAGHILTKGDLEREFPFVDTCHFGTILGKDFLSLVEYGISKYGEILGSYPHLSSKLEIEFDKTKETGSRIVKAIYKDELIDPEKEYTIASTKYLLGGGDGYSMLQNVKKQSHKNDGIKLISAVEDYMKELGEIKYPKREFRLFETTEWNGWQALQSRLYQ